MHEFGLCEGVLEAVQKRAAGRQVAGIRVRCGVRHAVDPASMAQAFGMIATGTEADGAAVEVVTVPATVTCHGCGTASEVADPIPVCPKCGSADVDVSGGDELTLESVSYSRAELSRVHYGSGCRRIRTCLRQNRFRSRGRAAARVARRPHRLP